MLTDQPRGGKLGIRKNRITRRAAEVLLLTVIIIVVLFQKNAVEQIVEHPISGLLAPIWAIAAYGFILRRKNEKRQSMLHEHPREAKAGDKTI